MSQLVPARTRSPRRISLQATATTEISTLSLHDALPIFVAEDPMAGGERREVGVPRSRVGATGVQKDDRLAGDRKSTRLNSSHVETSYAVFCLKKKNHSPPSSRAPLIVCDDRSGGAGPGA